MKNYVKSIYSQITWGYSHISKYDMFSVSYMYFWVYWIQITDLRNLVQFLHIVMRKLATGGKVRLLGWASPAICGSTGVISCALLVTSFPISEKEKLKPRSRIWLESPWIWSIKLRRFGLKQNHCISSPENITLHLLHFSLLSKMTYRCQ